MTKTVKLIFVTIFGVIGYVLAQESVTPTATSQETPSPTVTQSASAISRSVPLRFVPPPMEGSISLGIWNSDDKLVRVLHRESKIDNFTVEENSLSTTWDGKSDAGEDLPGGKYRARGFLVGKLRVDDLGKVESPPADAAERLSVKLMTNPLNADTRAVMEIGIAFDSSGSFLKTTDGLPLATLRAEPNLMRVAIQKSGEKAADVWQDGGAGVEHLRVSNIDKIMAFDCGYFELR